MRLRTPLVVGCSLLVLAWSTGAASAHHKDAHHPPDTAEVQGTTDLTTNVHYFDPDQLVVHRGGSVTFTNADPGPAPHTWAVVDPVCDSTVDDDKCVFSSGVKRPGETGTVRLTGLRSGRYQFMCEIGQDGQLPFSLVLEPHATDDDRDGHYEGMVGTLTVSSS